MVLRTLDTAAVLFQDPLELGLGGDVLDEAGGTGFLRLAQITLRLGDLYAQECVFTEVERRLATLLALLSLVALGGCRPHLLRCHLAEIERDDRPRPNVPVELHHRVESEFARVVLARAGARDVAPARAV